MSLSDEYKGAAVMLLREAQITLCDADQCASNRKDLADRISGFLAVAGWVTPECDGFKELDLAEAEIRKIYGLMLDNRERVIGHLNAARRAFRGDLYAAAATERAAEGAWRALEALEPNVTAEGHCNACDTWHHCDVAMKCLNPEVGKQTVESIALQVWKEKGWWSKEGGGDDPCSAEWELCLAAVKAAIARRPDRTVSK